MLKHFGVTPYLVFDGDYLPSKAATESERERFVLLIYPA
jgi:exonuclease-1